MKLYSRLIAVLLVAFQAKTAMAFVPGSGAPQPNCPEAISNDFNILASEHQKISIKLFDGYLLPDGRGGFKTCPEKYEPLLSLGKYTCKSTDSGLLEIPQLSEPVRLPQNVVTAVSNKACNYYILVTDADRAQ